MRAYVLGIAGGSGSGKTTVARALLAALPTDCAALLQHDSYYRHRPELSEEARAEINFDHPDALDNGLLIEHLDELRRGAAVQVPIYDFATHLRSGRTTLVQPKPIIVVDGLLLLADARLRSRIDLKLFVDAGPDVRILRRARRDIAERGRSFEQVYHQYFETVRPMHIEFVETSKRHADLVIEDGFASEGAIETLAAKLKTVISS